MKKNGSLACGISISGSFSYNSSKLLCMTKNATLPDIRSVEENSFYLENNQVYLKVFMKNNSSVSKQSV